MSRAAAGTPFHSTICAQTKRAENEVVGAVSAGKKTSTRTINLLVLYFVSNNLYFGRCFAQRVSEFTL